jgi:hypothetical protein
MMDESILARPSHDFFSKEVSVIEHEHRNSPSRFNEREKAYEDMLRFSNTQFPWSTNACTKRLENLRQHIAETEKLKQTGIDFRDVNSQLVVHGSKGNSRVTEAPTKYVREMIKQGRSRYNDSIENLLFKYELSKKPDRYDCFSLNEMFGLPHETKRNKLN